MIVGYRDLRKYRKKVAMVDGAFDPLHHGHVEYFNRAREVGGALLCNIAPDSYTSAKHAMIGFTRQMAQEFGPYGVTVNAVAPGLFPVSPGTVAQWESYGHEGQRRVIEGLARTTDLMRAKAPPRRVL